MKKTLIALAVTAFAASATAKIDLYSNEGTTFSTDGRVKVVAHKESTKVNRDKTSYGHSALSNDGSRLGLTVNHNITEDFYALGRLEIRFDDGAKGTDKWGNAYAKRAFVGLGHKQYGQVTFGKQLLVGDDVGRIGLDNYYNVGSAYGVVGGWAILNEASDSAVRYDYTGVQGLKLSADYSFANKHDTGSSEKAGYGAGAIYEFAAGEGTASVSLGYAHKDIETGVPNTKKDQDGVFGGFNYVVNGVKLGVDGGYSVRKEGDVKDTLRYVRTGLRYDIAEAKTGVYGNYSYLVVKHDQDKKKAHQFLLGADYSFHKHAKVFVEGKLAKARLDSQTKVTDKGIAAGLVVFW